MIAMRMIVIKRDLDFSFEFGLEGLADDVDLLIAIVDSVVVVVDLVVLVVVVDFFGRFVELKVVVCSVELSRGGSRLKRNCRRLAIELMFKYLGRK